MVASDGGLLFAIASDFFAALDGFLQRVTDVSKMVLLLYALQSHFVVSAWTIGIELTLRQTKENKRARIERHVAESM